MLNSLMDFKRTGWGHLYVCVCTNQGAHARLHLNCQIYIHVCELCLCTYTHAETHVERVRGREVRAYVCRYAFALRHCMDLHCWSNFNLVERFDTACRSEQVLKKKRI